MDVPEKNTILTGGNTMAIRTKSELMELLKNRIGEDTSDEALTLIEDFTDTLDSMENEANDGTDWKTKYEQNDAEWRQKYKNRFFIRKLWTT